MDTKSIFDLTMRAIDGKEISFNSFKGKKILIVNTASECGLTPQYEQLEYLHKNYGDKITVLGFPANDFGAQEPGTNDEIKNFCTKNYGVTFTMFEKISVKGSEAHPLYKWLKERTGSEPNWNFSKYFVDEKGEVKFIPASSGLITDEIIPLL